MGIVREQGRTGRGPASRDHPGVGALSLRARRRVEQGAGEGAGHDLEGIGRQGWQEPSDRVAAARIPDPRAEQLRVPVARESPCEQHERRRPHRLVVGDPRRRVEQRVLERCGGHRVDPRPNARSEPRVHGRRSIVPGGRDSSAGPVEPDGAREPVLVECALAEELAEPSVGRAQGELQLEQPLAGGHDPVREPEIVERGRLDVGHAPGIAPHSHRFTEALDAELPAGREQRPRRHRAQAGHRVG